MRTWIHAMWKHRRFITPECLSRWEPKAVWARLGFWLAFVLTSAVLFGQIHREGAIREQQLCAVVINVHENAKFRANTEITNLNQTLDYLRDADSKKDNPALYDRVKKNLPISKERVVVAQANVVATDVPPVCQKYDIRRR